MIHSLTMKARVQLSRKRPLRVQDVRGIIPQWAWIMLGLQTFWWMYDRKVTSQVQYHVPRPYVQPTESSPLSPFYSEPYTGPSRAFPPYASSTPNHAFPCGPLVQVSDVDWSARSATNEGFFYINQRQIGSTTLSGITARIARNVARREHTRTEAPSSTSVLGGGGGTKKEKTNQTVCTTRMIPLRAKRLRDRNRAQSFLWSVVREPVARLVSKFFHYAVSLEGVEATVPNLKDYVERNAINDYGAYFKSLSLRKRMNPQRTDLHPTYVQELLDGYDFLGVLERLDESLAVLQLLLGLHTEDLLHLPSRTSGSYEATTSQTTKPCVYYHPSEITLEMKEWFYSPEFDEYFDADVLVYQAVNKSLDDTIDALGRERVDLAVRRFQWAQRRAKEQCADVVKFPCSADGVLQEPNDCLFSDVACGYQCLDKVGSELAENQEFQQIG
jgi:hypothetical protein